ncbi:hypothetical protein E4T44_12952 [Aureobasidium sp. EXF-8845]|nr:hypothetical protein E4T44_12952 [Aureobasidium sp. EXF-8845]
MLLTQEVFYLILRLYSALTPIPPATTSPHYPGAAGPKNLFIRFTSREKPGIRLQSPSAGLRFSNKKRVSLVLGDAVVAPSDNIFSSPHADSDQPPDTDRRAGHIQVQRRVVQHPQDHRYWTQPSLAVHKAPGTGLRPEGLSLGSASATCSPSVFQKPFKININPDGDLELASPLSTDEDFEAISPSAMYITQIADMDANIDSGLDSESNLRAASPTSPSDRYVSPATDSPKP